MPDDERTVFITGAAGGIGTAHAEEFAKAGGNIVINDIDREGLESTAEHVRSIGAPVLICEGDISDPATVTSMLDRTREEFGSVDVLVNNAAAFPRNSWEDETWENWNAAMAINAGGLFLLSREVIPEMKERGDGVIINMSSTSAVRGASNKAAYTASKGAVKAVTGQMCAELAPYGIRVNTILPGPIKTQLNEEKWSKEGYMDFIRENVPAGRMGRPEEVADLAVYLASPEAEFINGASIHIDGGWTT